MNVQVAFFKHSPIIEMTFLKDWLQLKCAKYESFMFALQCLDNVIRFTLASASWNKQVDISLYFPNIIVFYKF